MGLVGLVVTDVLVLFIYIYSTPRGEKSTFCGKETSPFCQAQNIEASFWRTCTFRLGIGGLFVRWCAESKYVITFGLLGLGWSNIDLNDPASLQSGY